VAETVIDLGELSSGVSEPAPVRRPGSARAVLAAASALLLLVLGGSGYAPPPAPPTILEAHIGDMTFGSDGRYVVLTARLGAGPGQHWSAALYRLPDAALLSTTPVALPGLVVHVVPIGDMLVVTHQLDGAGALENVGLAPGTGRPVWRSPGRYVSTTRSGLVLLLDQDGQPGVMRWFAVDPVTGTTVWTLPVAVTGSTELAYADDGTPAHVVLVTATGHVEVRDPETGTATAVAEVGVTPVWPINGSSLWIGRDLALIGDTAYSLTDLAPRWRTPLNMNDYAVSPVCGSDLLCLFGRFGGVVVLDPATGRERWRDETWSNLIRVGPYLLAHHDVDEATDRALTVVEAATGRRHGELGRWRAIGEPRPDGRILAVRELPAEQRVWYSLLDPAAGTVRVLGVADSVTGGCWVATAVLVCRRLNASVGLWRLPAE
jgi:hypothetical protein